MRKKGRAHKGRMNLAEFSKAVIVALTLAWFVGLCVGVAVIALQLLRGESIVSLSDLLLYIGAPMTGGIIGYMAKSAYENKEKIHCGASAAPQQIDIPKTV